jgi:hypothetical protein
MVQSRGSIQPDRYAVEKLALLIRKGGLWQQPNLADRLIFPKPHERISKLTEFYRIAVWARNFRASRSVSIGKDLSSYGGAFTGGAHHVRE